MKIGGKTKNCENRQNSAKYFFVGHVNHPMNHVDEIE